MVVAAGTGRAQSNGSARDRWVIASSVLSSRVGGRGWISTLSLPRSWQSMGAGACTRRYGRYLFHRGGPRCAQRACVMAV